MMKETREKRENSRKSPTRKRSPPPKTELRIKSTFNTEADRQLHAVRGNVWTRGASASRPTEQNTSEMMYTSLTTQPSVIMKEQANSNIFTEPRPIRAQGDRLNKNKFCEFHKSIGHVTDKCWSLLNQIEALIQGGHLREYARRRSRSPPQASKRGKEDQPEASSGDKEKSGAVVLGKPAGLLNSIIGRFSRGGVTSSARKKNQRAMFRVSLKEDNSLVGLAQSKQWRPMSTFGPEDFEGIQPHFDDPMVVILRIANFGVKRVLIDQGSSTDVLYYDAFQGLGLK